MRTIVVASRTPTRGPRCSPAPRSVARLTWSPTAQLRSCLTSGTSQTSPLSTPSQTWENANTSVTSTGEAKLSSPDSDIDIISSVGTIVTL